MTIEEEVAKVKFWRHTIELPGGIITPGTQDSIRWAQQFKIPEDLTGMRVLDIGCSDGGYSFICEKRGAKEIVAIDDFSSNFIDNPNGFHVAHRILGSKVKFYQANLFDLNPEALGKFDLVLFLDVLYHLKNPMLALEKIAALCDKQVIIETLLAPERKGCNPNYIEFYEEDEINKDGTVWWAPSHSGLRSMLRASGFCHISDILINLQSALPSGVFHAFSPAHGMDVDELTGKYGIELCSRAAREVLQSDVNAANLPQVLRNLSISQFSQIKNVVLDLKGKHYHQISKWGPPPTIRKKPKILFTTPVLEHPPAGGPALRIENSIKALNQVSELHLVTRFDQATLGGPSGEAFYRQHCHQFGYTPILNAPDNPVDAAVNARAMVSYAQQNGIGIIWCGYGNISHHLMKAIKEIDPKLQIICDTDSVWSRFVLRELPLETDPQRRSKIERDGRAKEQEELEWTNLCEVTTAVSGVDSEYYRSLAADPARVHLFSNVIDLQTYAVKPAPAADLRTPNMVLSGTFYSDTCPMVRAARWVINEVLPMVRREIPEVTLYCIGYGADMRLADIQRPGVVIKGKVPSVLPYLCHADVALVPLKFESGTRFKILEAAACNIPIVSTTLGAEGIPVTNGTHIAIADEPVPFAQAIISILTDPRLAETLRINCGNYVKAHFSIDNLMDEAVSIFDYLDATAARADSTLRPR